MINKQMLVSSLPLLFLSAASAEWKSLRLTARGEKIRADEKFSVSSYPDGTVVILK